MALEVLAKRSNIDNSSAVPAKIFTTENTERTERGMGKTKHNIFLKIEKDFSFSIFSLCSPCTLW